MFGSLALLSGIALFSSAVALPAPPSVTTTPSVTATPQIYQILVGSLQGNTTYTPPYITNVTNGDALVFTYASKNHTLTESTFEDPCSPKIGGVDSGFNHSVAAGQVVNGNFVFNVTSAEPRWFYCRQIGHCFAGMVFAINPTENQTFADFQARAKASASSSTLPSLSTPSSSTLPSLSTSSSSPTPSSFSNSFNFSLSISESISLSTPTPSKISTY
ncbi:hypothetical protein V8E53_013786 [Lactarius tabidus]